MQANVLETKKAEVANQEKSEQEVYRTVGTGKRKYIIIPTPNTLEVNRIAREYRFF